MIVERWQSFVLAGTALVWAALLALPDDVFGRVPAYSSINRFAPDLLWAAVMAVCGVTLLLARIHPFWRAQAHAVLGILRVIIVVLVLSGGISVSGLLVASPFAALALLHFYEYLKLSQIARLHV